MNLFKTHFYALENSRTAVKSKNTLENHYLLMDDKNPSPLELKAYRKWPVETVRVNGVTFKKGVWRREPYSRKEEQLEAFVFEETVCSVTKEDRLGLLYVRDLIKRTSGDALFQMENGNSVILSPLNIDAFTKEFDKGVALFFPKI